MNYCVCLLKILAAVIAAATLSGCPRAQSSAQSQESVADSGLPDLVHRQHHHIKRHNEHLEILNAALREARVKYEAEN